MWTYGSVRIYVQKSEKTSGQIIARLQPVSGGTTLQTFGYESMIRTLGGLVVGDTNEAALYAFSKDGGTSHALASYEGSLGNWIMKGYKASRTNSTCQTIDTSQPKEAPVYEVEIELYRED